MTTHILITRPGDAGESLTKQLNSLKFSAIFFPLLKIMPCSDNLLLKKDYDIVIFISPNAVILGASLLKEINAKAKIATIGKGSCKQLKDLNINADIYPESDFTSEGLLQHPQLENIENNNILIIRGMGGREKLKNELVKRGANVDYADVYQRTIIKHYSDDIKAINLDDFNIIQVSNQQSLAHLIPLIKDAPWFANCQWWVLSERTIKTCVQYGINKQQCVLLPPGNDAFIKKINEI